MSGVERAQRRAERRRRADEIAATASRDEMLFDFAVVGVVVGGGIAGLVWAVAKLAGAL